MKAKLAIIAGDGVGEEITQSALAILGAITAKYGHSFEYSFPLMGGNALDQTGVPLPSETIDICKDSDAILLGTFGGTKWDNVKNMHRPEKSIISLCHALGMEAGISFVKSIDSLSACSPNKLDLAKNRIDLTIIKDIDGGLYYGEKGISRDDNKVAYDTATYKEFDIQTIAKIAFDIAKSCGKKLISVDKVTCLETSRLWRKTVENVKADYPEVTLQNMSIDDCLSTLVKTPQNFGLILTCNLFANIIESVCSGILGTANITSSSNIGATKRGIYQPLHSCEEEIAGEDSVNPIAMLISTANLLSNSLQLHKEANDILEAVYYVLSKGYRVGDISATGKKVSCSKFSELVALKIINN